VFVFHISSLLLEVAPSFYFLLFLSFSSSSSGGVMHCRCA